jgi:phage-related protein
LPQTEVFFFREPKNRSVPLLDWLDRLPTKVKAKCTERIDRLGELGHELHRPEADFLRDGIYELRASYQGIHYRMIYFFAGRAIVVVSHGLTKERQVPQKEIDQAIERKLKVEADFKKFTFKPE